MKNIKISPHAAVTIIAIALASSSLIEWRAIYAREHPPQPKESCVTCHSDAKTLKAIADKAGDPFYLVKRGDLKTLPPECLPASPNKSDGVPKVGAPNYASKQAASNPALMEPAWK